MTTKDYDREEKFLLMLNKLGKQLGYSNGARLVMGVELSFGEMYHAWETVMLKPGLPLKASSWEKAAKKVVNHLNNGKSLFAGKLITQESNGVPEFLIEMELLG